LCITANSPAQCPLWVMCGRRLGKNFLTLLQRWSGAVMCPAWLCGTMAAGPNALRGSDPNRFHALGGAMTQAGSSDPRNDRICITSSCPRQFVERFNPAAYAAAGSIVGSLNLSPRTVMAQAMRAILLARATAATLTGRRSIRRASQSRLVPCCRA